MLRNSRMIVEAGIMIGLSIILNQIRLFQMPQGGSITLGGYLPIFIFAIRWGGVPGMIVGGLYGLLDALFFPYIVHPVQFLLDYPIAYSLLGIAGFGKISRFKEGIKVRNVIMIFLASTMRLFAAVLSGVIFFKEFLPPDINYFLASFLYNAPYIMINTVLVVVLLVLIWKPLEGALKR